MKYFIYLIAIIFLLGINIGLFNHLPLAGQVPNLLFLLALCFSLQKKEYDFFFVSFIAGLFMDFYSSGFFGGNALAFLTMSLCVHLIVNNVLDADFNWKTLSLVMVLAYLFFTFISWLYGFAAFKLNLNVGYVNFSEFARTFIPAALYNLLLLYPIYLFSNFLKNKVDDLERRSKGVIR